MHPTLFNVILIKTDHQVCPSFCQSIFDKMPMRCSTLPQKRANRAALMKPPKSKIGMDFAKH